MYINSKNVLNSFLVFMNSLEKAHRANYAALRIPYNTAAKK